MCSDPLYNTSQESSYTMSSCDVRWYVALQCYCNMLPHSENRGRCLVCLNLIQQIWLQNKSSTTHHGKMAHIKMGIYFSSLWHNPVVLVNSIALYRKQGAVWDRHCLCRKVVICVSGRELCVIGSGSSLLSLAHVKWSETKLIKTELGQFTIWLSINRE